MPEKFFTVQELAARWKLSTKRIYQLKEEVGYTRIGGKILFPVEEIEKYERTHTVLPEKTESV